MRAIVCSDRHWSDRERLFKVLDATHPAVVIEGEANGADKMARAWGLDRIGKRNVLRFPAKWSEYGRGAGPKRNQQMIDEGKPDLIVAFHDDFAHSKGTKDMATRGRFQGLPVLIIGPGLTWLLLGDKDNYTEFNVIGAMNAHFPNG